jgi:hypothetical protein
MRLTVSNARAGPSGHAAPPERCWGVPCRRERRVSRSHCRQGATLPTEMAVREARPIQFRPGSVPRGAADGSRHVRFSVSSSDSSSQSSAVRASRTRASVTTSPQSDAAASARVTLAIAARNSVTRGADGRETDANGLDSRQFAPVPDVAPNETGLFPGVSSGFESRPSRPVHARAPEPVSGPLSFLHSVRLARTRRLVRSRRTPCRKERVLPARADPQPSA